MSIESQARDEAAKRYPMHSSASTDADRHKAGYWAFVAGAKWAASRPAPPATRQSVTEEMVERAARVLMRDYEAEYDAEHVTWHDFADVARAALEAALTEGKDD